MRDEEQNRDTEISPWAGLAFLLLVVIVILIALTGCAHTVAPKPVRATHASFDGNVQNSGIIAVLPSSQGFLVTSTKRDTYNALVETYGWDDYFSVPLIQDSGVKPDGSGNYVMTAKALSNMGIMLSWQRSGTHKPSVIHDTARKVGL